MIEMTKSYQTRDGRSVRILATDLAGPRPVAAAVTYYGFENAYNFHLNGQFIEGDENPMDLQEIREQRTATVTITDETGAPIAVKEITYYCGEGLEKLETGELTPEIPVGTVTHVEVSASK